jgi:hypothetical protein
MNQQPHNYLDAQTVKHLLNMSLEYIKLQDLELNMPYELTYGEIVNTIHGTKARVTLNNKYRLLLPDRYSKILNNDMLNTLVNDKTKIIYKGKKEMFVNQSKHEIEFV